MTDRTPADVAADLRTIADDQALLAGSRSPFAAALDEAAALIESQDATLDKVREWANGRDNDEFESPDYYIAAGQVLAILNAAPATHPTEEDR